jgi:hypothetical protein
MIITEDIAAKINWIVRLADSSGLQCTLAKELRKFVEALPESLPAIDWCALDPQESAALDRIDSVCRETKIPYGLTVWQMSDRHVLVHILRKRFPRKKTVEELYGTLKDCTMTDAQSVALDELVRRASK